MKYIPVACVLLLCSAIHGQTPSAALADALRGEWVGVLEYRDYSEPATSSKRVELPTWLSVSGPEAGTWRYVYDDGPGKTVQENDTVTFSQERQTYSETSGGKPAQVYTVVGYDTLKSGLGTLEMTSTGTDSGKPADMRLRFVLLRNLLRITEEVRSQGSTEPFAFRHMYRMVRAKPPGLALP